MAGILIVADDYTGANDTAVLMAELGFSAYTVLDPQAPGTDAACIAVSADSRACPAEEAYKRVYQSVLRFRMDDIFLYSKRIDSTLRGNLGAEIDAMLDAAPDDRCALIVPAFPRAGRIYKHRCLYVDGIPLDETPAAGDPQNPIHTHSALELLSGQSKYPVGEIGIDELALDAKMLGSRIRSQKDKGCRLILCEAETDEDLQKLAEAVFSVGIPFICADPGAFSCAVAKTYRQSYGYRKVFFLVGSVNTVTASQMLRLSRESDTDIVYLDAASVLADRGEDISAACPEALKRARLMLEQRLSAPRDDPMRTICLCTSGIFPEKRIDFSEYEKKTGRSREALSALLNRRMAALAAEVITAHPDIKGLFACGGDTAVSLCRSLEAKGERPIDEVIPLAVYGRLSGGSKDGMPIITKGGMVGDMDTLVECKAFLYREILKGEQL